MIAKRGPRIERGETRYLILDVLADQPLHGYGIMQAIQEKTGGTYRPSPGTVYPALQMLEDQALIHSEGEGPRKVYDLTEKGGVALESQRPALEAFYEDALPVQTPEQEVFFEQMYQQLLAMVKSIAQASHHGRLDTDKTYKIGDALSRTVQAVEEILKPTSK